MDEQKMRQIMVATVSVICDELSDEELAALNLVVQLDQDPRGRIFDYDQVANLFTVDGTHAHDETKLALATVVNARLG